MSSKKNRTRNISNSVTSRKRNSTLLTPTTNIEKKTIEKTNPIKSRLFKIYKLPSYNVTKSFIDTKGEEYELEEAIDIITNIDAGYHFRIESNKNYTAVIAFIKD